MKFIIDLEEELFSKLVNLATLKNRSKEAIAEDIIKNHFEFLKNMSDPFWLDPFNKIKKRIEGVP